MTRPSKNDPNFTTTRQGRSRRLALLDDGQELLEYGAAYEKQLEEEGLLHP